MILSKLSLSPSTRMNLPDMAAADNADVIFTMMKLKLKLMFGMKASTNYTTGTILTSKAADEIDRRWWWNEFENSTDAVVGSLVYYLLERSNSIGQYLDWPNDQQTMIITKIEKPFGMLLSCFFLLFDENTSTRVHTYIRTLIRCSWWRSRMFDAVFCSVV